MAGELMDRIDPDDDEPILPRPIVAEAVVEVEEDDEQGDDE